MLGVFPFGQAAFAEQGSTAPFAARSFANPQSQPQNSRLTNFFNALSLTLFGQDALVTGQRYAPASIAPLALQPAGFVSVNLILTLLATPPTPLYQHDWPNPLPLRYSQSHTLPLNPNLIGQDALVVGQSNLPPAIAPLDRSYRFSYTLPLDLNLLGQDAMVVGRSNQPPSIPPLVPRQSFVDPLKLNLLGQDAMVIGQTSIPAAIPPLVPRQAFTSTDLNLTLYFGTQPPKPFAKTDWPNPIIPGRGAGFTSQGLNNYVLSIPFAQYDWPLPKVPPTYFNFISWVSTGLNLSELSIPFAQTDWPLPAPLRVPLSNKGYTEQLDLALLTPTLPVYYPYAQDGPLFGNGAKNATPTFWKGRKKT